MKKFLTVLLALSVVFTYTVGTAFAATKTDVSNSIDTQTAEYQAALARAGESYMDTLSFSSGMLQTSDNYTGLVSKAVVVAAKDAAVYKAQSDLAAYAKTLQNGLLDDEENDKEGILAQLRSGSPVDPTNGVKKGYIEVKSDGTISVVAADSSATQGSTYYESTQTLGYDLLVKYYLSDAYILGANLINVLPDQLDADKKAALAELNGYDADLYSDNVDEWSIALGPNSNYLATKANGSILYDTDVQKGYNGETFNIPGNVTYTADRVTGLGKADKSISAKEFVSAVKSYQTKVVTDAIATVQAATASTNGAKAADYKTAIEAVAGAAKMVLETGEHPGALKDKVCSPGGTTIAGVAALENAGFRGAVLKACEACYQKSEGIK